MLRFIKFRDTESGVNKKFQYISCYGLSLIPIISSGLIFKFQYISCYGLSLSFKNYVLKLLVFQYISCYGLSWMENCKTGWNTISIHLMLRFIPHLRSSMQILMMISIHLMLRFIASKGALDNPINEFQYISCYGLSFRNQIEGGEKNNFNTSHVTVYLLSLRPTAIRSTISIHLMLRFI